MLDLSQHPVLLVMASAVVAALLVEIPRGLRVLSVVLEMAFGIGVDPQVLGLAKAEGLLGWLGRSPDGT